ncbi:seizure protein 6 homolog isoform X2 [Stegostoma tigrinum]|uniref:seizure protein 6 homolog isoform X2 n=1 Tax=Stegostoma tigrinum TaxID=3053191 RepID=UPI0028708643|nr:seizure protein 6 homolog isoform X2 [Stegostoma tigrinum]
MNKNLFSPYRLKMSTLCLLLACLMTVFGQDLSKDLNTVSGKGKSNGKTEVVWTTATTTEPDDKFHFVSTTPNININNHHPLLEEIIHETLLKKDFLGQEPLLTNKIGMRIGATFPATQSQKPQEPLVHQIVTNDTPLFSDITTTTMASTSPMTTLGTSSSLATDAAPLADRTGVTQGGKTPPMLRTVATTDSLTTSAVSSATSELPETALPNSITAFVQTEPGRPSPVTRESQSESGIFQNFSDQGVATALTRNPPAAITTTVGTGTHQIQGPNTEQYRNPAADPTVSSVASETDEETMTTTIITTTIITTVQTPVPCSLNFTDFEGYIESPEYPSHLYYSNLDCIYTITVYRGYGVELQVKNISLSEGEMLTIEGLDGDEPTVLANESILMKGQVIRSPSNQVSIHFQSIQLGNPGSFQFHYQAYLLSCGFPQKPSFGDVSVTSLHPGGVAHFYCNTGYRLQGFPSLTCVNGSKPHWSDNEPECVATCGGFIRNATVGRITSPNFPGNYSNNLTCYWLIEAPEGQKLHLHFEKVALAEDDDRVIIRNGDSIDAPSVYDSYEVEYLPIEGIISDSQHFFIELTTDSSGTSTGLALRYEAFEHGHCYEPFIKYGNFTTGDASYQVGTVAEFSCDPGYTLEQGSMIIECVDIQDPQWNETEPACRAVCSGEITDSAGVVLSPNWPEAYDKGQDCIWGIHVEEDKRIMLDLQVLNMGQNDVLTFYDGDDLTARLLGQYTGTHHPFKLYTTMADVTIQFQSDPATNVFGYQQGFVVHFYEVLRNDTCPEVPEILNGWKTTSHPELVHGTVVTYQCYPGFELIGTDILMCQWDLSWSGDPPTCEKIIFCTDPGDVDHSRKIIADPKFSIGSTVQYICNKGYTLAGSTILTCYNRQSGNPKWSDRVPKCIPEVFEPCHNPGVPDNGYQTTEKKLYQAGEALRFACYDGYELKGEANIKCIPGHPSEWSNPPPFCKVTYDKYFNERRLEVAKPASSLSQMQGSHIAIAVFIPMIIVALLIAVIYFYFTKFQGKSTLRLPLAGPHPYNHITVESAFDNPIYETGEAREYEVTI